jgi:GAF domain-containing protein
MEPIDLDNILRDTLARFRSETGTIHRLDVASQSLHLLAHAGLPPQLLEVVKTIPVGKNLPVTICNLQTDSSGVARPGAKQTGVGGALCVPIRRRGEVIGTFGIGTAREHDFSAAEINALQDLASSLAESLSATAK